MKYQCADCNELFDTERPEKCPKCQSETIGEWRRIATEATEDVMLKFTALLEAGHQGRLALVKGFKRGTEEEVAMLAVVNPETVGDPMMPVAVMIDGNPFQQFDPPDEFPDRPRIIRPH